MKKLFSLKFFNLLAIIFILALPYYLFDGKLFLGGDDTRLLYSYPVEFVKNITFFSWHNVSTTGISAADQYILPFLSVWVLLSAIIPSKLILAYLAFSLPVIVGMIGFQKLVRELFELENNNVVIFLGSLFYVFSPILIQDQYFIFLTAIWLIGLIPINIYLFIRYLKTSDFKYVFFAATFCIFFLGILYSLPWVFGTFLPLFLGLIFVSIFFRKKDILFFIKKLFIFCGFIGLTQFFWIANFALSYFSKSSNSFAQKFVSQDFLDTFTPTVFTTATGSIFYPILNLFHRQIAFDFEWTLSGIFNNYYDKTYIFNVVFIFVLFIGLLYFRKYSNKKNQIIFIFLFISFLISLFLFTVNIGPLKDLFTYLRYVPGFIMFRNFYDKFAIGYILIYSLLITYSLLIVHLKFNIKFWLVFGIFSLAIFFNFLPIKQTINSPLWKTKSIYRVINIPNEYLETMKFVNSEIPSTNTILSVPFGASIYTVIKEDKSNNVYVGASPVRIFSGVNDISGHYSFNFSDQANTIDAVFVDREFEKLKKILFEYNINYILVTKNLPEEVKRAKWLYDEQMLSVQNQEFINGIANKKIYTSDNKNYEIYDLKNKNTILSSKNITYQKVSPVKYRFFIRNINSQNLDFHDTYHGDWKIFIQKNPNLNWCKNKKFLKSDVVECQEAKKLFEINDLKYFFEKPVFDDKHSTVFGYGNRWSINNKEISTNYNQDFYVKNKDGSIDAEFVLYFKPQTYFYYGFIFSFVVYLLGAIYVIKKR